MAKITVEEILKAGFKLDERIGYQGNEFETRQCYGIEVREDDYACICFVTETYGGDERKYIVFGIASYGTFQTIRDIETKEQVIKLMDACFDIKMT